MADEQGGAAGGGDNGGTSSGAAEGTKQGGDANGAKGGDGTEGSSLLTDGAKGGAKEGDQKTDGQQKEGSQKAPESYADFKLPEGFALEKEQADTFKATAKELGLSQEAAQKLVDMHIATATKADKALQSAWEKQQQDWTKQSAEFLGDKKDEKLAIAAKALDRFGTKELRQALVDTGLGNHPELIKFAIRVGEAVKEDGFVDGKSSPGAQSTADLLYPSMSKK